MLKINAGFSKKLPAEEEYSSQGYHLSIESELPDVVINNPEDLTARINRLFHEVRVGVENQINGSQKSRGNGQNGLASSKQRSFIVSLARRRHGMNATELQEWAGTPVDELTKQEASQLIEKLKNGSAKGGFDL